ncbi:MAG: methyltransferase domain-containing protein [Bacteroidota bacterium]
MEKDQYIHAYSEAEKERLLEQVSRWRDIQLHDLPYQAGDEILEIGCGVGALLGEIASDFPSVRLAGIDIDPGSIAAAKIYLQSKSDSEADLRSGQAQSLPWEKGSFDHVMISWVLEHNPDPSPILAEAYRVLRPGGSIRVIESDYQGMFIWPPHPAFDALQSAYQAFFALHGNAMVGRRLGSQLAKIGFEKVKSELAGVHWFQGQGKGDFADQIAYVGRFMEPSLADMAKELPIEEDILRNGFDHFSRLPEMDEASFSATIYRATAWKSGVI